MKTLAAYLLLLTIIVHGYPNNNLKQDIWKQVRKEYDITGNGKKEIIRLTAFGTRIDSLTLQLAIFHDDSIYFEVEWPSHNLWFYSPKQDISEEYKVDRLKKWFLSFNKTNHVVPLDFSEFPEVWKPEGLPDGDIRDQIGFQLDLDFMNNEKDQEYIRNIWNDIKSNTPNIIYYSCCIETTGGLIWSKMLNKYIRMYICC